MALSYKDVADIMQIIDASDCEEVILETEGIKLTVRRGARGVAETAPVVRSPEPAAQAASAAPAPSAEKPAVADAGVINSDGATIRAPMVGTFYRSPSPDKPPFVEVGNTVAVGDPLCLIEVMKLYTTIEATEAGTIRQVVANDGELVEFDQPLFVIDPA